MAYNYLTSKTVTKGFIFSFLLFLNLQAKSQNDYAVVPIPHQVFTAALPVAVTADDYCSSVIPLTFSFDYFGNIYSEVVVSTNGYIDFRTELANTSSPWSFSTQIPDANFPTKNTILGCYHDINNNNGEGTITNAVIGTAPYRKFIVIFNNNSQFSCMSAKSSFQMILYETLNIIDVQIIEKELCETWNGGRAVIGIINSTGALALAAPGRNTGQWTAFQEGWRFSRPTTNVNYFFTKCDDDTLDGYTTYNLLTVRTDLSPADPDAIVFYTTFADAQNQTNPILGVEYTSTTANTQTIYAVGNGMIKNVVLTVIDCSSDADGDSIASGDEDLNSDGNLSNDDTDNDGIPNFLDNDDDGDLVLTNEEYVFNRNANTTTSILDTDSDGIPNYLDNDDDGDGILTVNEDANGNHNPMDDDSDNNGTPNYLQNPALGVNYFVNEQSIVLYPNPADVVLNIENKSGKAISGITIYSVNGSVVKEVKTASTVNLIPVSDLQRGVYFVKIIVSNDVLNYKFIKK